MIKRITDPDGIYPDVFSATSEVNSPEVFYALLTVNTPEARIARFREVYPDKAQIADQLQRRLNNSMGNSAARLVVCEAIKSAEQTAIIENIRPKVTEANSAKRHRRKGSESAAKTRKQEAMPAHALVKKLYRKIEKKDRSQAAIAKDIKTMAEKIRLKEIGAERVATYTERAIINIIWPKKVGSHLR